MLRNLGENENKSIPLQPIDALYIRVRLFLVGLFHYEYCK